MGVLSVEALGTVFDFQGFPVKLGDASERALDQAAASILSNLRQGFLAQKEPGGNPWLPSFAGQRRKAAGTGQTLFDTGNLFHSLQLYTTGTGERTLGTDVEYAPGLQFGTGSITARPFMFPSEDQINSAFEVFAFKIKEAME